MCSDLQRYSLIEEKNPREIVLLRGVGCFWKKCVFCDYHLDCNTNIDENFKLNKHILDNVTGKYQRLEVINSGSYFELDNKTKSYLIDLCLKKGIKYLHFESHYKYCLKINEIKEMYKKHNISVIFKTGVETFDEEFREENLKKGFQYAGPTDISKYFDEICLLYGINGQSIISIKRDIEIGLKYFQRVCINIMVENTTSIKPNVELIKRFMEEVYPLYIYNDRVDILVNNCDFGVGEKTND